MNNSAVRNYEADNRPKRRCSPNLKSRINWFRAPDLKTIFILSLGSFFFLGCSSNQINITYNDIISDSFQSQGISIRYVCLNLDAPPDNSILLNGHVFGRITPKERYVSGLVNSYFLISSNKKIDYIEFKYTLVKYNSDAAPVFENEWYNNSNLIWSNLYGFAQIDLSCASIINKQNKNDIHYLIINDMGKYLNVYLDSQKFIINLTAHNHPDAIDYTKIGISSNSSRVVINNLILKYQ
jgi:hypothetical protein